MLPRVLKPSNGKARGVPPVARTSFVYGHDLPDLVETVLRVKSTAVASSWMMSMPAAWYHSAGRISIFLGSEIRALDSFVRSSGRFPSLVSRVMLPLNLSSRRVWTTPKVPLPLWTLVS